MNKGQFNLDFWESAFLLGAVFITIPMIWLFRKAIAELKKTPEAPNDNK